MLNSQSKNAVKKSDVFWIVTIKSFKWYKRRKIEKFL